MRKMFVLLAVCFFGLGNQSLVAEQVVEQIKYNNPGLVVDLGVGLWAWPLPMDYDKDGDNDLVVVCPDVPSNGTYFFENVSGDVKMPVFKAAVKIDKGARNPQLSIVNGKSRILTPNYEYTSFKTDGFKKRESMKVAKNVHPNRVRANQWRLADYDGDGKTDLIVGVGDWTDYGWDNAYDEKGNWTNGPLRGVVYFLKNQGTNKSPKYAEKVRIEAGGEPLEVYGMPSPNLADFDNDGDLDILCGEFLDGFTYFQNVGSKTSPKYLKGERLKVAGREIKMDLEMITPTAIDWDKDGDVDLIVGDEDGRVAFVENTNIVTNGVPQFREPKYFQQEADTLKFGALVTPVSFDWDADGDEDLVCGNSAGYIGVFENLDGGNPPKWDKIKYLEIDGEPLRILAGENGSIQGPCESKWGYTTISVADWNHDGLPDIVANSIFGKVVWFENVGSKSEPKLSKEKSVVVSWGSKHPPYPQWNWWKPGSNELVTQWRTTPFAIDWNRDGLVDLVSLDHDGYLAYFERRKVGDKSILNPPKRIFDVEGVKGKTNFKVSEKDRKPLRLNPSMAGKSGRRKICLADWNNDGLVDLLVNSRNTDLFLQAKKSDSKRVTFNGHGEMIKNRLAGHTTSPTVANWNGDGKLELLIGAEDGRIYRVMNE